MCYLKEYWNGLSQFVVRRSLCSEIWRTTLDFARSKIIWAAALLKEGTAETERFLFPESSSLNGLIGGKQIYWLLVGNDDETKNFERGLSYGIVCPLSPAPQIDAALEFGANEVNSRLVHEEQGRWPERIDLIMQKLE